MLHSNCGDWWDFFFTVSPDENRHFLMLPRPGVGRQALVVWPMQGQGTENGGVFSAFRAFSLKDWVQMGRKKPVTNGVFKQALLRLYNWLPPVNLC